MTVYSTCRNCGQPLKDAEFYFCADCTCDACDGYGMVDEGEGDHECWTCMGLGLKPGASTKEKP